MGSACTTEAWAADDRARFGPFTSEIPAEELKTHVTYCLRARDPRKAFFSHLLPADRLLEVTDPEIADAANDCRPFGTGAVLAYCLGYVSVADLDTLLAISAVCRAWRFWANVLPHWTARHHLSEAHGFQSPLRAGRWLPPFRYTAGTDDVGSMASSDSRLAGSFGSSETATGDASVDGVCVDSVSLAEWQAAACTRDDLVRRRALWKSPARGTGGDMWEVLDTALQWSDEVSLLLDELVEATGPKNSATFREAMLADLSANTYALTKKKDAVLFDRDVPNRAGLVVLLRGELTLFNRSGEKVTTLHASAHVCLCGISLTFESLHTCTCVVTSPEAEVAVLSPGGMMDVLLNQAPFVVERCARKLVERFAPNFGEPPLRPIRVRDLDGAKTRPLCSVLDAVDDATLAKHNTIRHPMYREDRKKQYVT